MVPFLKLRFAHPPGEDLEEVSAPLIPAVPPGVAFSVVGPPGVKVFHEGHLAVL